MQTPKDDNLSPRVILLDPDGHALKGAWIGVGAYGESEKTPTWTPYSPHGTSADDGVAELLGRSLSQSRVVLYARHEGRNLTGLQAFDREKLMAGVEMKLRPACRVHGVLQSSTLKAAGRTLGWTNVYLYDGDASPLSFSSKENRFDFYLPPGKYRLDAYARRLWSVVAHDIEVREDQRELALDAIDLPATKLATLIGKPAPELREIKEWSNVPPQTRMDARAGLRAKLTFWGHWCGPCVREMPHLMKLHDAYSDRGLIVMSVHDASVESIAEMNKKLATTREREWWGRDIPFPVAASTAVSSMRRFIGRQKARSSDGARCDDRSLWNYQVPDHVID